MQPGFPACALRPVRNLSSRLLLDVQRRLYPLSATLVMLLLGGSWSVANAQKTPSTPITQCGTLITQPGIYALTQSLQSSSLTVDCIRIKSPGVSLNLAGFNLTGPGGTNVTAAGVRFLDTAAGVQFAGGGSTIQGFGVGILIAGSGVSLLGGSGLVVSGNAQQGILVSNASNVVIEEVTSAGNGAAGLEVAQSSGVIVQNQCTMQGNTGYGLWVHSSSGNQFFGPFAFQNKLSGIYVGESASGQPRSGDAKASAPAPASSQHNVFLGSGVISNTVDGIIIGSGDTLNYIVGTQGQENGGTDAVDQNGDCTHNTWTQNTFQTRNPACIQ